MKFGRLLDWLEPRTTMTEPISASALLFSTLKSMTQLGIIQADGGNSGLLTMARLARQAQQGPARMTKAPAAPQTSIPIGNIAVAQPFSAAAGRKPGRGTIAPTSAEGIERMATV